MTNGSDKKDDALDQHPPLTMLQIIGSIPLKNIGTANHFKLKSAQFKPSKAISTSTQGTVYAILDKKASLNFFVIALSVIKYHCLYSIPN